MPEETIVQVPKPTRTVGPVTVAVIISALVVGSAVYALQKNQDTKTQNDLQSQITTLKSQLATSATATPRATATPTATVSPTATASTGTTILTNDQIFQEVATQMGFVKNDFNYFRIFSQDKVQYSVGIGTTYAYKTSGTWHISGHGNQSDVIECSALSAVPETYRQPCITDGQDALSYLAKDNTSVNYPIASAVAYINLTYKTATSTNGYSFMYPDGATLVSDSIFIYNGVTYSIEMPSAGGKTTIESWLADGNLSSTSTDISKYDMTAVSSQTAYAFKGEARTYVMNAGKVYVIIARKGTAPITDTKDVIYYNLIAGFTFK